MDRRPPVYRLEQVLEIIRTDVTRSRCAELDDAEVPDAVPVELEAELVPEVVPEVDGELLYDELLDSGVPVTSISWPECRASSLSLPSRK